MLSGDAVAVCSFVRSFVRVGDSVAQVLQRSGFGNGPNIEQDSSSFYSRCRISLRQPSGNQSIPPEVQVVGEAQNVSRLYKQQNLMHQYSKRHTETSWRWNGRRVPVAEVLAGLLGECGRTGSMLSRHTQILVKFH